MRDKVDPQLTKNKASVRDGGPVKQARHKGPHSMSNTTTAAPTTSPATPVAQETPQTSPATSRQTHPDHAHINALIHAGVVTHIVNVNEAIDPPFVVTQIRELRQVGFVAAFQTGLIAFGCHGALPDVLASIAQPAVATAAALPPPAADVAPLMKRFSQLEDTVASLLSNHAPQDHFAELRDGIGAVQSMLAHGSADGDLISALKETLAATPPDPRIDALQQQLTDLRTTQHATADPQVTDQTIAVLSMLVKRVETVAQAVTDRAIPDDPALELAEVQERLDQLQLSVGRSNKAEQKNAGKMQRMLQDLALTVERQAAPGTGLSAVEEKLDDLHRQNGELTLALAQQQKLIEDLTRRPAPKLDLTEQRADIARFGAELAASVDRLEHAARDLATEARMPAPRVEEVLAAVGRIPQATHDRLAETVDLAALEQDIGGIRAGLGQLPDHLGLPGIDRKLTALSQRSDPANMLSAQNQHLSRFGSSISGVKERLDAMAENLSAVRFERAELENLSETTSRIETQMLRLSDRQSAQTNLAADRTDCIARTLSDPGGLEPAKHGSEAAFDDMINGHIRNAADHLAGNLGKASLSAKDA